MSSTGGDDAVAAAIARVKAKQAATTNTEAETSKKPAVAAAIARAKAKQAAAQSDARRESVPDNTEMAKLREERKRKARERKAAKQAESSADLTEKKARLVMPRKTQSPLPSLELKPVKPLRHPSKPKLNKLRQTSQYDN